jgi:DNA invertase Pin-like site-specific DNA recombinase
MTTPKFVAYYRVSTERQGDSRLGLEAQQEIVRRYLAAGGWPPVEEYTEVETGKGANALARRPQLQAALEACKRLKAVLLVAKVDRLTRNMGFLETILNGRVEVAFCDVPQVQGAMGRFILQQMASVAQLEAGLVSERTKAALSALKARLKDRGERLGAPAYVYARVKAAALERAQALAPDVRDMRAKGFSIRKVADELNRRSIPSPGGTKWHPTSAARLVKRIEAAG